MNNINCFSNEEDKWRNSKIKFEDKNNLKINLEGKFITERGRINCSLRKKWILQMAGYSICDKRKVEL